MTVPAPGRPARTRLGSARTQVREQFSWLPNLLRVVAVPVLAWLWWALAFLPWTRDGLPSATESWPPTLPVLFTDLSVAVFGPLGASLVVVVLARRGGLAFASVLLGLVVSAWVTLTGGDTTLTTAVNGTERKIMLVVCAVAALVGLAFGAASMRSLQGFGFFGLLAVFPVVSLLSVALLDPDTDRRWLTRAALVALLVMIGWRRWSGVLVWPIFFALFWLLHLAMSAVAYGAQTLRHPGGSTASIGTVADAMLDLARSGWRELLAFSWDAFWPAAVIAAVVVAGRIVWRRLRGAVGTRERSSAPVP